MAKFDVDGQFVDELKNGLKALSDIITRHAQTDGAITALAENHAKISGAPPEHMDAHVYMHKKMLKKAIGDHQKMMEGQGGPGVQGNYAPANGAPSAPQGVVNKSRMQHTVGGPTQFPQGPMQQMMGPARPPMAHPQMPMMAPSYQGNVLPRSPGASSQ